MFGSNEKVKVKVKVEKGLVPTLISRKTQISGDLHFSGELIIEGNIKGNIYAEEESEAVVRVAEQGTVEGEICVPSVIINGLVNGDIHSSHHIELAAKAVVVGNVYYNLIEMVMGAEVNGNLMHLDKSQKSAGRLAMSKKELLGNAMELPEHESVEAESMEKHSS
ncbi:MAG: polymer-forming cytoskeletal protein [Pseudomonadales bacterium]|nr:polymer-forming cytoskeletal protein [Pseudomonadales bacterium]